MLDSKCNGREKDEGRLGLVMHAVTWTTWEAFQAQIEVIGRKILSDLTNSMTCEMSSSL